MLYEDFDFPATSRNVPHTNSELDRIRQVGGNGYTHHVYFQLVCVSFL